MTEAMIIFGIISTLAGAFFAYKGFRMFVYNNTRETQLEQIKYFVLALLFFV